MTVLLLGPILRAGDSGEASVWVETSDPCTVTVRDASAPTFSIAGHHYALVDLTELELGREIEYDVRLDGELVWPDPALALPPSSFTLWRDGPYRISGGSCRQQAPQEDSPVDADDVAALGADALVALASEVRNGRRPMPHLLLLTGDQVYADEQHPSVIGALRTRRGGPPPDDRPEVSSFEEYTWLYQRTWSYPAIRWLLSVVPSLMIFDDHDVIDDWNTSAEWVAEMSQVPWWDERLHGALMSYWIYQHLGNLSISARAADPLLQSVRSAEDGAGVLERFAESVATGTETRLEWSWAFDHDAGPVTVRVLDSRNGRVLDSDARSMMSPLDWSLLEKTVEFAKPHLLLVSSVPWLLPEGVHRLERWASALTRSRIRAISWTGEQLRRGVDLEHWAAFGDSFGELARVLSGRSRGGGRTSQVVLSGDVHFAYIAEMELGNGLGRATQLVSSPLRQASATHENVALRAAASKPFDRLLRSLITATRRAEAETPWELTSEIWYDNNIGSIVYDGDTVTVGLDRAVLSGNSETSLERLVERQI